MLFFADPPKEEVHTGFNLVQRYGSLDERHVFVVSFFQCRCPLHLDAELKKNINYSSEAIKTFKTVIVLIFLIILFYLYILCQLG